MIYRGEDQHGTYKSAGCFGGWGDSGGALHQSALGNIAAGAVGAANTGRLAYGAARAYQVYSVVDGAFAVGSSAASTFNSVYNGAAFNPLSLVGFAPALGWVGEIAGRARGLGNVASAADDIAPVASLAGNPLGVLNNRFDVSDEFLRKIDQSRVCFVAETQVAVPDNYEGHFFAGYAPDPDDGSGSWVACGLASLLGASVLLGDRKKRSRQISDSNEWETEGLWWIERDPDLDVSELDFEDVCDELLTGSPGMS